MSYYKFHITGYASIDANSFRYSSDRPIDVTVYAKTAGEAIVKAEKAMGETISLTYRKIVVEEIPVYKVYEE